MLSKICGNKAPGGDIPLQILKQSGFTYSVLTDCINDAINKDVFPESLKIANITSAHKTPQTQDLN